MSIEAKIIADSINPAGCRLTTYQLRYPKWIHQEMLTHRVLSRNASSTRAIPLVKQIDAVRNDPAMPVFWGKNQKGMSARKGLSETMALKCQAIVSGLMHLALYSVNDLSDYDVHKQTAGRYLDPWAHVDVVLSGTDFDNFFWRRCHKDAQPEMQVLAVKMAKAMRDSAPVLRDYDPLDNARWHLPYVTDEDREVIGDIDILRKMSVARCCRVSYKPFNASEADPADDIRLHDDLLNSGHWSPFEHVAMATGTKTGTINRYANFRGWLQYRTLVEPNPKPFDFSILDQFGEQEFIV